MATIEEGELGFLTAGSGRTSATSFPLEPGQQYGKFENVRLKPGGSQVFYFNGNPGTVVTFQLIRIPNTGGHYHGGETTEPLAVGTCVPGSVTLNGPWPQNAQALVTAPDACGSIRFINNFSMGQPPTIENQIDVMYDSLLPIPQSAGIELKPPEPIHPSPYWADPPFIEKLRTLGEKYSAQRKKNIVITDASLLWGGRFDINAVDSQHPAPWQPPHAEHRNGRQADVRLRGMNDADRKAFLSICAEIGLTAEIHSGNHWHIRLP